MVFVATLWIVFYIFRPSLVVELAHFGVQTRARRSTVVQHGTARQILGDTESNTGF
jgi:hypothetical protein